MALSSHTDAPACAPMQVIPMEEMNLVSSQ